MKKLIALTVLAVPTLASAKPSAPAVSHAAYVAQVRKIIERNEARYGKAMKEKAVQRCQIFGARSRCQR